MIGRLMIALLGALGLRSLLQGRNPQGETPAPPAPVPSSPPQDEKEIRMTEDDGTKTPKPERIGASPKANDWDPGPVADAKIIKGFRSADIQRQEAEIDPLEAKHRSKAYRDDFRTLDYADLSTQQAMREAERRKIKASHSTWVPPKKIEKSEAPASQAQFASFGGSTIQAEIYRTGEQESVPSMTPDLPATSDGSRNLGHSMKPAPRPLGAPDPHGRTPEPAKRSNIAQDPLVEKHRSAAFDSDWRTLDYSKLSKSEKAAVDRKIADEARADDIGSAEAETPEVEAETGTPAAFRVSGVSAPIQGAVDILPVETADDSEHSPEQQLEDAELSGSIPVGSEPMLLEAARDGQPDELTRINGIGPSLERVLFEAGIFHFDQIAGLTEDEIEWVEWKLACERGRITKEDWLGQAMAFAAGS